MDAPFPSACHYKFCIYNFNNECFCKSLDHDELGTCTSRIIVELDENYLHELKRDQLTRYNMETFGRYTYVPNRTRRNVMREQILLDDEDEDEDEDCDEE